MEFVWELGPVERVKMCGKQTPVKSQAPIDEDGRPVVRYQIPRKNAKVVDRSLLRGRWSGIITSVRMELTEAGPSQAIPNFSREEALGWFW